MDGDEITAHLRAGSGGDRRAMATAFSTWYAALQGLAERLLSRERDHHTIEASGLIAESYFRLIKERSEWNSQGHFLAVAGRMMRRILVDHARARAAVKRGAGIPALSFDETAWVAAQWTEDVVGVQQALEALQRVDAESSALIELRFFGGLTNEEIARRRRVSLSTLERRLRFARTWMYRYLNDMKP